MEKLQMQKRKVIPGFTLIEVIVVVAIIGIIAAVAWPVYESQSQKNRRTEAIDDLSRIQVFMNRCYASDGGFACCDNATLDTYRAANPPPIPPNRLYTLTLTVTNQAGDTVVAFQDRAAGGDCRLAQGYQVTAVPTGAQLNDTKCSQFSVDHIGNRNAEDDVGVEQAGCWGD